MYWRNKTIHKIIGQTLLSYSTNHANEKNVTNLGLQMLFFQLTNIECTHVSKKILTFEYTN